MSATTVRPAQVEWINGVAKAKDPDGVYREVSEDYQLYYGDLYKREQYDPGERVIDGKTFRPLKEVSINETGSESQQQPLSIGDAAARLRAARTERQQQQQPSMGDAAAILRAARTERQQQQQQQQQQPGTSDARLEGPQLPLPLLRSGSDLLAKINASIGSKNDAVVMRSFVQPPSLFVLAMVTVALGIVTYIIMEMANYYEIKNNWSEYRCSPTIAPFAKFYGYDLAENTNFCISQSVKDHAPGVIDPIYAGISNVSNTIDGVYQKVSAIEQGVSGLLGGFESFLIEFANSFGLIGTRIRMSVIRMKDILSRIYGVFIALTFSALSAITFGENLICNPLTVFLATVSGSDSIVDICCFAPDTAIAMADGTRRPIASVTIGDHLAGGSIVTSTYLFDGAETAMVRIDGIHVSGNHYLLDDDGHMIQASAHQRARPDVSLTRLWCIGTSNNRIPIVNVRGETMIFADYEETEEADVIAEAQAIAERSLNGSAQAGPTVPDYSLGLDPTFLVYRADGTWCPLTDIRIGDELMGGGRVIGLIREVCQSQCMTPAGYTVSAATLVLYEGRWVRAAHVFPTAGFGISVLRQLMVTDNASITVGGDGDVWQVRDYAEITSLEIQAPYDANMTVQ